MAHGTRKRMIERAASLFRERGYAATGVREIAAQAGTNRGVIYHHFPGGKTELATEALAYVDGIVSPAIAAICAELKPASAMHAVMAAAKTHMVDENGRPGCTVAAIALGADSADAKLRDAAERIFRSWQQSFRECLHREGWSEQDATNVATLLMAALEGGLIFSRAEGNTDALDRIARGIEYVLKTDTS